MTFEYRITDHNPIRKTVKQTPVRITDDLRKEKFKKKPFHANFSLLEINTGTININNTSFP